MSRMESLRIRFPSFATRCMTAAFVAALYTPYGAVGAGYRDVEFAPAHTFEGKKLVLNGVGVRKASLFQVDVYAAALYLPAPTQDAAKLVLSPAPAAIQMAFFRDVAAEDSNKVWDYAFERNCGGKCAKIAPGLATLKKSQPNVVAGDRMEYRFDKNPSNGVTRVTVLRAEKPLATIEDSDFASVLLSTWIGAEPPTERLKDGLLGKRESP